MLPALQGLDREYSGVPGHRFDPLLAFQPPSTLLLHSSKGLQFIDLQLELPQQPQHGAHAQATDASESGLPAASAAASHAILPSTSSPPSQPDPGPPAPQHYAQNCSSVRSEISEESPKGDSSSDSDASRPQAGCQSLSPLTHLATSSIPQQQSPIMSHIHRQQQPSVQSSMQQPQTQNSSRAESIGMGQEPAQQCELQAPSEEMSGLQQHAATQMQASAPEPRSCVPSDAPTHQADTSHHQAPDVNNSPASATFRQRNGSVWSMSASSSEDYPASEATQVEGPPSSESDADSPMPQAHVQGMQMCTLGGSSFCCSIPPFGRRMTLATATMHGMGQCFQPEHFICDVLPEFWWTHYVLADYALQVVLQTTSRTPQAVPTSGQLSNTNTAAGAVVVIAAVLELRPSGSSAHPQRRVAIITATLQASSGILLLEYTYWCGLYTLTPALTAIT